MDATDFRIDDVQKATINGAKKIIFSAYQRRGDAFVRIGQFSAPPRTPTRDLWKIAAEAGS